MELDDIPAKTGKGAEVIQNRTLGLPSQTRQLLIIIKDKPVHALLKNYDAMGGQGGISGLMEILNELLRLDLISVAEAPAASHQQSVGELADTVPVPYAVAKQYLADFVHSLLGDDSAELVGQIYSCEEREKLMELVDECGEMVAGIAGKKKADEFVAGVLTLLPD